MKTFILASVLAVTALAGIAPAFVAPAEAGYWVGHCYYGEGAGPICHLK